MSVLNMKQKKQRYPSGLMLSRWRGMIVMIRRDENIQYSLLWNGDVCAVTGESATLSILNFGVNPPLMHNDARFTPANGAA